MTRSKMLKCRYYNERKKYKLWRFLLEERKRNIDVWRASNGRPRYFYKVNRTCARWDARRTPCTRRRVLRYIVYTSYCCPLRRFTRMMWHVHILYSPFAAARKSIPRWRDNTTTPSRRKERLLVDDRRAQIDLSSYDNRRSVGVGNLIQPSEKLGRKEGSTLSYYAGPLAGATCRLQTTREAHTNGLIPIPLRAHLVMRAACACGGRLGNVSRRPSRESSREVRRIELPVKREVGKEGGGDYCNALYYRIERILMYHYVF